MSMNKAMNKRIKVTNDGGNVIVAISLLGLGRVRCYIHHLDCLHATLWTFRTVVIWTIIR